MAYSTKDIAKMLRKQLKAAFPQCKFSVTMETYSGGSSITIALMEAPFRVFKTFDEFSEEEIHRMRDGYKSEEQVKAIITTRIEEAYDQVNHIWLHENTYLMPEAIKVLTTARDMARHYNWDDSDSQYDHFDVHFYLSVHIGKWDKPFRQVEP